MDPILLAPDVTGADFIPTMPPRLPQTASVWTKVRRARENLLAGWTEDCFKWERFDFTLLNQRYIVCNHPRYVRQVFLDNHANYDVKSPQMRRALEPLLGDGLFISDGDLWRQRRSLCAPPLHADRLGDFVPVMISTCQEMAASWREKTGSNVDVLAEMGHLTARIIGRTVFGDDTSQAEAEQVVASFARYQRSIEQLDYAATLGLPAIRLLSNIFSPDIDRAAAADIHRVIDNIIARRRNAASDNARPNLLTAFLNGSVGSGVHGCPVSDTALRNEAIVMFMAGHETTANTLAWAWYVLGAAPQYAALLHQELNAVLGGRAPGLHDVPNLPITRAIIEEVLRLYPPVPVLSRQARGPDRLGKLEVKAGDIILVVPWLLHRHDHYWDTPNAFRPERFMPGAPRPDRYVYLPFSVGHRVCLGQRFGLTEAILSLATLAQEFELDLAPRQEVDVECRLTLRPAGGLPMRIRRRHSHA